MLVFTSKRERGGVKRKTLTDLIQLDDEEFGPLLGQEFLGGAAVGTPGFAEYGCLSCQSMLSFLPREQYGFRREKETERAMEERGITNSIVVNYALGFGAGGCCGTGHLGARAKEAA